MGEEVSGSEKGGGRRTGVKTARLAEACAHPAQWLMQNRHLVKCVSTG